MPSVKQPKDMTAVECLEAIARFDTEHDLDCEEGIGSERCTPCLAAAARDALRRDRRQPAALDSEERALTRGDRVLKGDREYTVVSISRAGADSRVGLYNGPLEEYRAEFCIPWALGSELTLVTDDSEEGR